MAELDLISAEGQLLTDRRLRVAFARDPGGVAVQLKVSAGDRLAFLALDAAGLEAQARVLLRKRLHETRQLLVETAHRLGEAFDAEFLSYAETRWPRGHRRHLVDAAEFSRHLRRRGYGVSAREANRVRFAAARARLHIRLVSEAWLRGRHRSALQVLYRRQNGRAAEILLFLG